MEDTIVELTDSQIVKDQLTKVVLGAAAGFAAGKLVEKIYDGAVKAYRLKKATAGES